MKPSAYDLTIGCGPNSSKFEENMDYFLNQEECHFLQVVDILWGNIGFLGCLMHAYIIFCYNFKQYVERIPREALIMILSCYDFIYCLGIVVNNLMRSLPVGNWDIECPIAYMVISFYRNSLFMMWVETF